MFENLVNRYCLLLAETMEFNQEDSRLHQHIVDVETLCDKGEITDKQKIAMIIDLDKALVANARIFRG